MTSLGKKDILYSSFYKDGSPCMSIVITKTVYSKKDGTFWIRAPKRYQVHSCAPRAWAGGSITFDLKV